MSPQSGYDFAFLADNVDLNWYQHRYQAEYSPVADTTFKVYQATDTGGSSPDGEDSDGDAYALAYDHETGNVEGPIRIGYNPIPAGDTHGVPAMTIDGDGYVHVFFGSHGFTGPLQYARSEHPHDVSSWIHPPSGRPGSADLAQLPAGTYTCLAYSADEDAVYVLYRSGSGEDEYPSHVQATLGRSEDNGETWTDVNRGILDFSDAPGDHYDAYVSSLGVWADRLHVTWTIAEDHGAGHDDARRNVYHAAFDPETGAMETMSGTDLGTTVTWADAQEHCMVKDTGETVIAGTYHGTGDSIRGFNHAYDPDTDTAYIPASYALDEDTSQLSVFSYEGVTDRSGNWEETELVTESPPVANTQIHLDEDGRPQVEGPNDDGDPGLWMRDADGTWEHVAVDLPTDETRIQRGVYNGAEDFSWYVADIRNENGESRYNVYAMGRGQPAGAGAEYPTPPRNLRVVDEDDETVTIDWDEGRAGPSGVARYDVYVDGSKAKEVTEAPPSQPTPRTWATLEVGSGEHSIDVRLVAADGTESGPSADVVVTR